MAAVIDDAHDVGIDHVGLITAKIEASSPWWEGLFLPALPSGSQVVPRGSGFVLKTPATETNR